MGLRGPAAGSKEEHLQKGNFRPSRHDDPIADTKALDFVYGDIIPTPPDGFPDIAKQLWTTQLLLANAVYGFISFLDLVLFGEYCLCYAEVIKMREEDTPKTTTSQSGVIRIHPLYKILQEKEKLLIVLSREFGFSPGSRTRVNLIQQGAEEKEEEFTL